MQLDVVHAPDSFIYAAPTKPRVRFGGGSGDDGTSTARLELLSRRRPLSIGDSAASEPTWLSGQVQVATQTRVGPPLVMVDS